MRIFAIGDIHGHLTALEALVEGLPLEEGDLVVFLGDYVDKGPDVRGTIEYLLEFATTHRAVFLRGNHDQMMVDAREDSSKFAIWECLGGENPLASYGAPFSIEGLQSVPAEHWEFLQETSRDWFETDELIFVHGGIRADRAPDEEDRERLLWLTLEAASLHDSGRTVICGHSRQESGQIADLGHTICIDTGINSGGWLTGLALDTFEFWQVNADGELRGGKLRQC
jgi:serine/threonine protein phosphatase 1